MSVRESTSIELPRALSGSNVLMACPGVTSMRTVAWATTAVGSAATRNANWADTRVVFMALVIASDRPSRPRRSYFGRSPMAGTFKRERVLQVLLVVLGLLMVVTNVYPLVTSFLAGLRPTGGPPAPIFCTTLTVLVVFLRRAGRNAPAHRSLIAYTVWSS